MKQNENDEVSKYKKSYKFYSSVQRFASVWLFQVPCVRACVCACVRACMISWSFHVSNTKCYTINLLIYEYVSTRNIRMDINK